MKKGFTLIELLAVIVILAIIALIALPVVFKVIDTAKKNAFKSSAYGLLAAAETKLSEGIIDNTNVYGIYTFDGSNFFNGTSSISFKGNPDIKSGQIKIGENEIISIAVWNGEFCYKGNLGDKLTILEDNNGVNCLVEEIMPGYAHYKEIEIDSSKIDSDLQNYPLRVLLNKDNFDFSKVKDNGNDIVFTDFSGNKLDYEMEYFAKDTITFNMDSEEEISNWWTNGSGKSFSGGELTYTAPAATENGAAYYYDDMPLDKTKIIEARIYIENNSTGEFRIGVSDGVVGSALIFNGLDKNGKIQYYNQSSVYVEMASSIDFSGWHTYRVELDNVNGMKVFMDDALIGTAIDYSLLRASSDPAFSFSTRIGTVIYDWVKITKPDSASGVFNVKIPEVSSSVNNKIRMYYGNMLAVDGTNKNAVWDNNYVVVNHMNGNLLDSTTYNNHSVNDGTRPIVLGNGIASIYRNVVDLIYIPHSDSLNFDTFTDDLNVQVIFKRETTGIEFKLIGKWDLASNIARPFYLESSGGQTDVLDVKSYDGTNVTMIQTTNVSDNNFHLASVNYDTSVDLVKALYDQIYYSTENTIASSIGNTANITIGNGYNKINGFNGVIDEVRISNVVRSDSWLKADYYNLITNDLIVYGVEQSN